MHRSWSMVWVLMMIAGWSLSCESCQEQATSEEESEEVEAESHVSEPQAEKKEKVEALEPVEKRSAQNVEQPMEGWEDAEVEVVGFEEVDTTDCAVGVNAMGFELWRALELPANATISPASISLALSMLLAGARGETAEELASALHLSTGEAVHHCWAGVLTHWEEVGALEGLEFEVANRLFAEQNTAFVRDYFDLTGSLYRSSVRPMDFRGAAEASRQEINAWIEDVTRDRIQDLLPPGSVDAQSDLFLVNAIYLLANWQQQFDERRTRRESFRRADGTTTSVQMMNQTARFPYAEIGGVQLMELTYEGEALSMVVVLPARPDGLTEIEQELDAATLERWLNQLQRTEVDLGMPRFTIDGDTISLVEAFESLGVRRLFGDADLSGIVEESVFVNSIYHKAFVEVDEEGTEAAAATAVGVSRGMPAPNPEFRADRPFLFMIRDRTTEMVLFLGRVGDP